ncbi:molybdenum ABC transporter, periplasmic molybdate-binding protein [Pseudodesulfovibrio mercurii]|uniref:Molybdenum ABC transporter, periplasmic molybdate-binding protein n=1 Tax=Pseudodesulfovibrio mercurii TaxID=641491 RepID=F0JG16_9BACT|nr:substrate-binding domain-containing protein [Pseudodesulfovibrio mercurii]EGB15012.1 molybdenum ABC transporter, periplasmic molybdate-binding protein [Pseudodesulfovibrio mercurii]
MTLTVLAAGSLRKALPAMAEAAGLALDVRFGPAGLLRNSIEDGLRPDLFLSASMSHVRAVARLADYGEAAPFLENLVCLFGRRELLAEGDALRAMLDPDGRLGMSTPGADPGGDYALTVFDRAERVRPGSRAMLRDRARSVVGGGLPPATAPTGSPVIELFRAGKVDLFLGYRTTALDALARYPGLAIVDLPPELAVRPVYGAVARNTEEARAALAGLGSAQALAAAGECGFTAPRKNGR